MRGLLSIVQNLWTQNGTHIAEYYTYYTVYCMLIILLHFNVPCFNTRAAHTIYLYPLYHATTERSNDSFIIFGYPGHLRADLVSDLGESPAYVVAERELISIRHFVRSPLVTSIFYDTT